MTHKDFQLIAAALADPELGERDMVRLTDRFAVRLKLRFPAFNEERFKHATYDIWDAEQNQAGT